jgi:hypothetical protein
VSPQIAAGGPRRRFNINPQSNAPSPIRLSLVQPHCKTTAQITTWCIPKNNLQVVENGAASSRDISILDIYTPTSSQLLLPQNLLLQCLPSSVYLFGRPPCKYFKMRKAFHPGLSHVFANCAQSPSVIPLHCPWASQALSLLLSPYSQQYGQGILLVSLIQLIG